MEVETISIISFQPLFCCPQSKNDSSHVIKFSGHSKDLNLKVSSSIPTDTYPERAYAYQKKMDGACKGLYDKYNPTSNLVSIICIVPHLIGIIFCTT